MSVTTILIGLLWLAVALMVIGGVIGVASPKSVSLNNRREAFTLLAAGYIAARLLMYFGHGPAGDEMAPTAGAERVPVVAENAPQVSLDVSRPEGWSRDGAIVGTHQVRLGRFETGGRTWYLGCVPCFNAMTTVGVTGGKIYWLNGLTSGWSKNYVATVSGQTMRLSDVSELQAPVSGNIDLIGLAQSVDGCTAPGGPGFTARLADAVGNGQCLGK